MKTRNNTKQIEQWFDGERDAKLSHADIAAAPEAQAHLAYLETVRKGAQALLEQPEIRDEQFDVFMEGIRGRIGTQPRHNYRGFWALASVMAASVLVALSLLVIFSGSAPEARALTEIDAYSTEIDDATVDIVTSEDGSEVWITVQTQKDLW